MIEITVFDKAKKTPEYYEVYVLPRVGEHISIPGKPGSFVIEKIEHQLSVDTGRKAPEITLFIDSLAVVG